MKDTIEPHKKTHEAKSFLYFGLQFIEKFLAPIFEICSVQQIEKTDAFVFVSLRPILTSQPCQIGCVGCDQNY